MARRDTIRIGIVGCGNRALIGRHVAEVRADAAVTAIVEPTAGGRERAARWYPEVPVLDSLDALLEQGVDAALVTTPNHTHAEIASTLLRAGVAVFLEKPMTISLESADSLLQVAVETGTPLYVGHNYRHSEVVRTMRRAIDDGMIGEVRSIWVRHFVGNGGDFYFKDWRAERSNTWSLLLEKASHDIDVVHYLGGAYSDQVVGMGGTLLYDQVADRGEVGDQIIPDWFSLDNWPPLAQRGLNPRADVEDVSMVMMGLRNGVLASYQQCHFTPDYWRNYTVIGTEGRLENFGDTSGGVVRIWNKRREWSLQGDVEFHLGGVSTGHGDADQRTMAEFLAYAFDGERPLLSPLAARESVAVGYLAAASLRAGSLPQRVPLVPPDVRRYFEHEG